MATRILIVDDDDIIRESLVTVLTAHGFECAQSANGKYALAHLQQWEYEVVITDIEMPEMNGIGLLEAANKILANTSFIFITAHASIYNRSARQAQLSSRQGSPSARHC